LPAAAQQAQQLSKILAKFLVGSGRAAAAAGSMHLLDFPASGNMAD
jgi:hypothetical protein